MPKGHEEAGSGVHVSKVFTYAYIVLLISELCMKMCLYMQHANITLYILDRGGTAKIVGIVTAAQLIASLIFRPIAGSLSDRNRLLPMVFGSVFYFFVTALWQLDLPVALVPLVAALQGIGFSFASTGVYSLAADVVPIEHVTSCYTYLNLVETMAAAVSTTLAIHLRNINGYRLVFTVVLVLSFVMACCILLLCSTSWRRNSGHYYHPQHLIRDLRSMKRSIKTPHEHGSGGRHGHGGKEHHGHGGRDQHDHGRKMGFFARSVDKNALKPAAFYMMIMFAGEAILGFLVAYGKTENISNPGVFYTVQAVTVYIVSIFVGRIDERLGTKAVLLPGFICYFIAMTGIFIELSYNSIIICGIFFGMGVALVQPELSSIAVRMAGQRHRGKANSTVGIMIDIGGALAGLVFGVMVDSAGYRSIYATSAILIVLIAAAYLVMNRKKLIL